MSPTTELGPPKTAAARAATALFVISVVFFLIAGTAIVIGQIATLAAGDASAARDWADALGPFAFGGASVAGLLSFALSYGKTAQHD